MDEQTRQLLINAFSIIIGLVILQMVLKEWDKRAKAKAAREEAVKKPLAKKRK